MNTQTNFFKTQRQKFLLSDKDMRMNSGLDPPRVRTSSSPKRIHLIKEYGMKKTFTPVMPNIVSSYNAQNLTSLDTDKLQDELLKSKNELNKRNKEYAALKIAFSKLDTENKRNIKIIEEVLDLAAKQKQNNNKSEEYESEVKNILANTHISSNNVFKLKEAHIVNSLKRQVHDFKILLNNKEDELTQLKNSAKVSKFHELDVRLKNSIEELNDLNEQYTILKNSFIEKDNKLKEVTEERDYYKAMMIRMKNQYDETKDRLQYLQDQNIKLSEIKKNLEDKNSSNKFKNNSIQSQMREKDNTIISLRDELKSYEEFKGEKEKLERHVGDLQRNVKILKDDLDKKNRKVKELEKINNEMKEKCEILNVENKKIQQSINSGPLQTSQREKDKKIKRLEEENSKFREEIKKLKEEVTNLKEEMRKKSEIAKEEEEAEDLENDNARENNEEENKQGMENSDNLNQNEAEILKENQIVNEDKKEDKSIEGEKCDERKSKDNDEVIKESKDEEIKESKVSPTSPDQDENQPNENKSNDQEEILENNSKPETPKNVEKSENYDNKNELILEGAEKEEANIDINIQKSKPEDSKILVENKTDLVVKENTIQEHQEDEQYENNFEAVNTKENEEKLEEPLNNETIKE